MEPVRLITQTPVGNSIEIRLKRWFQTREFWVNLASWSLVATPIITVYLASGELSAKAVLIWTLAVKSVDFAANQYLKNTSKSIVVDKATMIENKSPE